MFFIKRINLDESKCYQSSSIVNYTTESSFAKNLFETSVIAFVKEEKGREASETIKIIDINGFEQVNEPLIDCILLYRLISNPNRIFVYQRKTTVKKEKAWTWGTVDVLVSEFRQTQIFELEEFNTIIPTNEALKENTKESHSEKNVVTYHNRSDFLDELRNSPRFKEAQLALH